MQPDFFEDPQTTRRKQLIKRRKNLMAELDTVTEEIAEIFRERSSYGISRDGNIRLVILPSGTAYLYEVTAKDSKPMLVEVDLQLLANVSSLMLAKETP